VLILCVFHTFILYSLLYYFQYFCMLPHGVINDGDDDDDNNDDSKLKCAV